MVKKYTVKLKTSHDTGRYNRNGKTFTYVTEGRKVPQVQVIDEHDIAPFLNDPFLEVELIPDPAA